MNKSQYMTNLATIYTLAGNPFLERTMADGTNLYSQSVLKISGSGASYTNINFYVTNEGLSNEAAYNQILPGTDSQIIMNEVATDPLGIGYTSMTTTQIITSLNTYNIPLQSNLITIRSVMGTLGVTAAASIIATLSAENDPVINLAISMLSTYGTGGGLDICNANTQSYVQELVTSGILTSDHQAHWRVRALSLIKRLVP